MKKETSKVKWYIVYELLANSLFLFYKNCIEKKLSPGEELYSLLINNSNFRIHNGWIDKFENNFGVNSLEPLHIYASISSNSSSLKSRIERIRIIFEALNDKHDIADVDFDGCPTPNVARILSARDIESQRQIWDLFQRVHQQKGNGLKDSDFKLYKDWYGVDLASFTIFLFWIESDSFIPLDKNTRTFLVTTNIITSVPKDYETYISIVSKIEQFNYNENENFGERGIFREVAQLSYNIINNRNSNGINTEIFSKPLWRLYNKSIRLPKGISIGLENQQKSLLDNVSISANLGFRIIAIKPLEKCDNKFLNILKQEKFYYFEKAFNIEKDKVLFYPEKIISLYDINVNSNDVFKINVSAIVGKNGSGKSSLIELFFRIINNIAFAHKKELNTNDLILEKGVEAELYYILSGNLYKIIVKDAVIQIQNFIFNGVSFEKKGVLRQFEKSDFENFFYTVAVNYSHYALNSELLGNWIQRLFHKNDGYQTPLVINPMRTKGIIDINSENELLNYRLMSNLLMPVLDKNDIGIRQITEYQKAKEIHFSRILDKNKVLFARTNSKGEDEKVNFEELKTDIGFILQMVVRVFGISSQLSNSILEIETQKYIIRKLVRISRAYSHYYDFFNENDLKFDETRFEEYLNLLKDDSSHITYKLKQAINYLKYPDLLVKADSFVLNINEHSEILSNFLSTQNEIDIIELLPPPIFKASIKLIDKSDELSDFEKLSSGEKQAIHSISSILYHIKYLDSVNTEKNNLIGYRNINLLLDEIELYYHPEMQRKYLFYLLKMISKLSLTKIEAINICLVTHSPYILSDIPDYYTLRLENGTPKEEEYKTFGANIHDLLANDFFMKDGFIGEFAKNKIQTIIDNLVKPNDVDEHNKMDFKKIRQIIESIGEPFLKRKLLEMYMVSFPKEYSREEEIKSLRQKLSELENEYK